MKSPVIKRSIVLGGHKTSVSLEEPFWLGLKDIALGKKASVSALIGDIDILRGRNNLSSAIRLFVLGSAMGQANEAAALAQPDARA